VVCLVDLIEVCGGSETAECAPRRHSGATVASAPVIPYAAIASTAFVALVARSAVAALVARSAVVALLEAGLLGGSGLGGGGVEGEACLDIQVCVRPVNLGIGGGVGVIDRSGRGDAWCRFGGRQGSFGPGSACARATIAAASAASAPAAAPVGTGKAFAYLVLAVRDGDIAGQRFRNQFVRGA
jgi:hypothetical protein